MKMITPIALALLAGGCSQTERGTVADGEGPIVSTTPGPAYSGIGEEERIRFTGTEPFWGGEIAGGTATYSTPEKPDGELFPVERFAGNNGLGFTGDLGGQPFRMALTPAACSDGMSDRTYPFTVTLQVAGEQRDGCAWTDKHPFSGPAAP